MENMTEGSIPAPGRMPSAAALSSIDGLTKPCEASRNDGALAGLSPSDQARFWAFGRGPSARPDHPLIHLGFQHWARVQPDALAATHRGETITYGELNAKAELLARRLLQMGVRRGDHVGLFLRRSIPMLIGQMACLKIGAAYVPQDIKVAPEAHIRAVCRTAGIRIVLTNRACRDRVPPLSATEVLEIDGATAEPLASTANFPDLDHGDVCFVLFTSGTTGTPNGVRVTHANLCNILLTAPGNLGMGPGLRVAQILSIAFDMAAWEVLGALSNGAALVIRGDDFTEAASQADVVIATPSVLASIDIERCRGKVKTVAVAGEPCPRPLADAWSDFATFYNSCGPTETTIINTAQHYHAGCAHLTIGKPTPNNTVYVLDEDLRPCPIGEPGVMWAGGVCVTKGYLGNPDLTADRYRPDPFLGGDAVMFNTRDLGRWTPDGELEHLGRTDDQVKLRGFRVELDGVSRVLERAPGCMKAVTLKYDERRLVYFVAPMATDTQKARALVAKALPYYCEPADIIAMPSLPLTDRGKVDKRLLMTLAAERLGEALAGVAAE